MDKSCGNNRIYTGTLGGIMPKFMDYLNPLANKNPFRKATEPFFFGSPEKHERVSTLLPNQQALQEQLSNAGMAPGAGGAFGAAADYYRGNLSENPADMAAFAAPEMRRFQEETIPGLSEQFAGMGAGGLSSSGFRNAGINAGTDLAERLGAIRANLRQASAQGLTNIGQMGLQNFSQDVMTQPGSQGFLSQIAPALGTAAGAYFGGPAGAAVGGSLGNMFGGNRGVGANTSPYGGGAGPNASPQRRM